MKQTLKISLLSIFFLTIYFYLFNSGLIKYLALGSNYYFGDYLLFKNALNCVDKGLSPYTGPAELSCVGFNYGHSILIFTPFKNFLANINLYIVPVVLLFFFIVITVKILNPKNFFSFFLLSLALLNPSSLLLIERMNLDILLYLIIIIIAFNKLYLINWLLVAYAFLFKFHPFIFGIIIFVEKEKRKIFNLFFIFIFILSISLIFIYIYRDEYSLMFKNSGAWKMGLHYLYSIKTIPKVLKEAFSIHYGFSLLLIYLLFIHQVYKKSINLNINLDDKYNFEKKLFLLSSNSLLFCFFVFSNAFYREVFLILTIPYLLSNINNIYFKNILLLLCLKYLYNFLYTFDLNFETFYHVNDVRIYEKHFLITVFFKGFIDYILMLLIGSITLRMNLNILKLFKKAKIQI